MKKDRICSTLFLVVLAGFLMTSCSTYQGAIPPKKPVPPPKKLPELGARSSPKASPYRSHGIVLKLTARARQQMKAGEPEHAFSTLERAIKIDPSDPVPWNMLAGIQLKKGNMDQAEQLARKSNLLAKNNKTLRRQNWLIIAEALEQRGFNKEGEAAKRRAGK
jgi:cytochrome c-type biogenesis protein CcmH/NrfG